MEEIWKDIKGFEGRYQVSNLGRVRSLLRNGLIRKQKLFGNTDYLHVVLLKDRKYTRLSVHRLVAEHFVEGYKEGYVVNHKDENVMNNTVSNLEWCTYSYNNNYGTRANRAAEKNKISQPTMRKVRGIGVSNQETIKIISAGEAARFTGDLKHRSNIVACLNGRQKTAYGYRWEYCD